LHNPKTCRHCNYSHDQSLKVPDRGYGATSPQPQGPNLIIPYPYPRPPPANLIFNLERGNLYLPYLLHPNGSFRTDRVMRCMNGIRFGPLSDHVTIATIPTIKHWGCQIEVMVRMGPQPATDP
jgi:hypothetical protein